MTPTEAKRITADALAGIGRVRPLTARSIGFSDLARGAAIFVTVHGWTPNAAEWDAVQQTARTHGFIINTEGH